MDPVTVSYRWAVEGAWPVYDVHVLPMYVGMPS